MADNGAAAKSAGKSQAHPTEYLNSIKGKAVIVKLNTGVDFRGILTCLDGYMNIALQETEEYEDGQLKRRYGDSFIRGNNVYYISEISGTREDDD